MKSFVKKKRLGQDMVLQITSMADIFMILLVFLLKNYSASLTSLSPDTRVRLPVAQTATRQPKDALKIEINEGAILVDEKPVVKLNHFEFYPDQATEATGPLYRVLAEERRKPRPNPDSTALLLADERTPYATIQRVLAGAANSGFVDLQLVVVEAE